MGFDDHIFLQYFLILRMNFLQTMICVPINQKRDFLKIDVNMINVIILLFHCTCIYKIIKLNKDCSQVVINVIRTDSGG